MDKTVFYKYYLLLLVVLCTWISTVSPPPMLIRLAYLIALFVPAFVKAQYLIVPVMACFTSAATYGFSCSYMPTELYFYLGIMGVLVFFSFDKISYRQTPPLLLVFFCVYVLTIDLITGGKLENIDYSLLIIILSFFFISKDGRELDAYIINFVFVSIVLCIFFFTFGQTTIEASDDGRVEWKDPNYLGNVCGMGVVLAYNVIVNKLFTHKRVLYRICLLTIIAGVIMLVLNASRGAFLSMAISITIITLFSKIKFKTKVTVTSILVLGVICMYALGLFDILEERFISDDGTGNARTLIWAAKMNAFSSLSFTEKLFGLGYRGGFELAFPGGYGFHNDYMAFLVDYGFIGLFFFLALMLYPIVIVGKNTVNRPIVISLVVFFLICCFTLEPLTAGRLAYWLFYLFIVIFARWSRYALRLKI